jgi:hypothetical protein
MRQQMRADEAPARPLAVQRARFDPLRWLARVIFGSKD